MQLLKDIILLLSDEITPKVSPVRSPRYLHMKCLSLAAACWVQLMQCPGSSRAFLSEMPFGCGTLQPGCMTCWWWLCCSQHHGNPEVSDNSGQCTSRSRADTLTESRQCCFVHSTVLVNCKNSFSLSGPLSSSFKMRTIFWALCSGRKSAPLSCWNSVLQRCKNKPGSGSCCSVGHALNLVFCVCQLGSFGGPCAPCGLWLGRGGPTVLSHRAECGCSRCLQILQLISCEMSLFKWVNHRCNFQQNYQLLRNTYGSMRGLLLRSHCAAAFLKAN